MEAATGITIKTIRKILTKKPRLRLASVAFIVIDFIRGNNSYSFIEFLLNLYRWQLMIWADVTGHLVSLKSGSCHLKVRDPTNPFDKGASGIVSPQNLLFHYMLPKHLRCPIEIH